MANDLEARIRNVTAVLGPTNTGKTHLAIERMLGHESGMIGLPLRLLAREVYDRVVARVGADKVALVTGEEKIKPENARYWVATVEAMPRDIDVAFLAIDEVQLCGDPERGHVFTDRLLHARGRQETLLLGAQTMRDCISDLIPGANFVVRPRLSKLTYSGQKKITRLPARTAIVAFSAQEVYEVAELIRRQRGGAAVVLGALSPRTRNAQVALYQSGDVEYLVATDAIGMGLNLDVDHVAFTSLRKFDGYNHRNLTPSEIGQIAGRAGRHMNDGTFGVTGAAEPLDPELVERLEDHSFDPVRVLQWRNRALDFSSLDALTASLRMIPGEARLTRARNADDVAALEVVSRDHDITELARGTDNVQRLWDVCQVPDYRKISSQSHAELIATLFKYISTGERRIPEDWFSKQVSLADRTDGDIDTLSTRLAHIRTWTFVANRADWLADPAHWQIRTREIEDSLSDALHDRLIQRFVDRRTSALMKGMRDKDELNAEIGEDGAIMVENHFVGRLTGFRLTVDGSAEGIHEKATRQAATQVLSRELGMRVRRVVAAGDDAFKLTRTGRILWRDEEIAKLEPAEDALSPLVTVIADEHLAEADRDRILERLTRWIKDQIADKLKPLVSLGSASELQGLARGMAFRLRENIGALKREDVSDEVAALDQPARAELRKFGVRFGAFNIFFPVLMKPAPAELAATLWLLKNRAGDGDTLAETVELPRPGLTSVAAVAETPEALYRCYGFHVCGPRAVRLDILERLADLIRPLLAWRNKPDTEATPPKGSTGDGGFTATDDMMSILGCSAVELGEVLKTLGFKPERRPIVVPTETETSSETAVVEGDGAATSAAENTETAASQPEASTPEEGATTAPPTETPVVDEAPQNDIQAETSKTSPDDAPAQPAVASDNDADKAQADDPAEPAFIEIWRPNRANRGGQGRYSKDHRTRGRRRGAGHGQHQPVPASASGTEAAPADHSSRRDAQRNNEFAGGHRGHAKSDKGGVPDKRGRGHGHHQGHNKGQNQGRGAARSGKGRRDDSRRSPAVVSASPPKGSSKSLADSPFAALAALKADMAKQGGDPSGQ